MSALNTALMVLIPVGVGIALGKLLSTSAGGPSVAIWAAFGTATSTFWMVAGIFMIVGGFTLGGVIIVMLGFYFAAGNYQRYKEERTASARTWLAGSK
jgi:hypothetical protein